jgi:hypothetical protein
LHCLDDSSKSEREEVFGYQNSGLLRCDAVSLGKWFLICQRRKTHHLQGFRVILYERLTTGDNDDDDDDDDYDDFQWV